MWSDIPRRITVAIGYVLALFVPIAVALLFHGQPSVSPFFLCVAVVARLFGFGPALVCAFTSSASIWNFVLPDDPFPFHIQLVRMGLFVVAAVVISSLSKQRSAAEREAEERYRSLVELSPDGIVVVDPAGTIVFANSALAQIVGAKSADEVIGRRALDFLPQKDHEPAQQRINQLLAGQPTPWVITRAIRLDGSVVMVERSGVPLRRGNKLFAQGFVRDLTERLERESRLDESRRRLEALFNSAIDAIVFLDSDGRYVDANPAATALLGYSREELLQRRDMTHAFHDGEPSRGETVIERKDGTTREIEYRAVSNVLPGLHFMMMHDIHDRKEAERSLRQLSGRLLGLQDEERRRIARQLHDTTAQNLAALKLNLATIGRAAAANATIREVVDESTALADESISEIRTLSYLLHPPLIDEAGLVTALRWFVRGFESRSGIRTELEIGNGFDRLPREMETALFRIVQESLTNIQRHSGSSVARIRLERGDQRVRLEVVDEGTGLPPHLRSNQAALIASGLGIAGIHQRATDLGGEMQVDSNSGGTKVTVELPVA